MKVSYSCGSSQLSAITNLPRNIKTTSFCDLSCLSALSPNDLNASEMGKKEKVVGGKKGEGGGGGEDSKRDQKLQAILLADSFSKSFRPVTWEKPKVLLPLVNVPMIEYTIEFLAQNGVEEVISNLASFEAPLLT